MNNTFRLRSGRPGYGAFKVIGADTGFADCPGHGAKVLP